jgi:hypothetical protein
MECDMRARFAKLAVAAALGMVTGCQKYDAPPAPAIEGLKDGRLTDPKAPLVVSFGEPIDPDTLVLKLVYLDLDIEGNLGDEDKDDATELETLFAHEGRFDIGGTAEFVDGDSAFRIVPAAPLPIGPSLAVLVEAGLSDTTGQKTIVRKRLVFSFESKIECNKPSKVIPSGYYFYLANVTEPIGTQVQLLARMIVDPDTGRIRGQFTNADRDPDQTGCPTQCADTEVCRLLPEPECVIPSEFAGTPDEYPDYIPNETPPRGYSFTGDGCAVDQQGGAALVTFEPVDVVVQSPAVTLRNARFSASFSEDDQGALRATGSFRADSVLIGTSPSGEGVGGLTARFIPKGKEPKGIPDPPAEP